MSPDLVCDLLRRCGREGSFPRPVLSHGSAWNELVEQLGPYLRICVRRSLRSLGLAPRDGEVDELVQETYCRLLDHGGRRLRGFKGQHAGQGQAFLRRVTHRVVLDRLRFGAAHKRTGKSCKTRAKSVALPPAELGYRPQGDPEQRLLSRERSRLLLERCREAGGVQHRDRNLQILRLAFLEGRSSQEIAQRIDGQLKPSSVDSVIHRLRRRLVAQDTTLGRRRPAIG